MLRKVSLFSIMGLAVIVMLNGCTKPNALFAPDSAIQATWLISPQEGDERARWIFSNGQLQIELEKPLGTRTIVQWTKAGVTQDFLTYSITSDATSYLTIDRVGWAQAPGVPNKLDIPIKGSESKFAITTLTKNILYLSSIAVSGSGTVGGEAQRGFIKN